MVRYIRIMLTGRLKITFCGLLVSVILFVTATGSAAPQRESGTSPAAIYSELEKLYHIGGTDGDSVRQLIYSIMQKGDYTNTLRWAKELHKLGKAHGDDATTSYGAAIMGSSYIFLRKADSSLMYLNEAVELGEKARFDWGLSSAYNSLGLYELNFENFDGYQAIRYFQKGVEAARRSNNLSTLSVLLTNIADVYYLKGDVAGLPYALEAYDLAREAGDEYHIFTSTYVMAAIYFIDNDYENALKYIQISETAMAPTGEPVSPYKAIVVYTLHGCILTAIDDYTGAQQYFEMALSFRDDTIGDELVMTYLNYGDYHKKLGRWPQALEMYLDGIKLSEEMHNEVYHNLFYLRISEAYEAMGDYVNAMSYHKEYNKLSRKQFDIEKERSLNEMRVQYDLEKKEAEIEMSGLRLTQEKRKNQILWLIVLVVLLSLAGTLYFYRRRNKLYLEIVKQSQKAVRAQEKLRHKPQHEVGLRDTVADDAAVDEEVEKYANSPLSSEKSKELFERLEHIMDTEKLYRDGNLNVDRLAERLDSNRSYLSRIINEFSGLNFNNYINKYRIEEAVNTLSDADNNIPLKALAFELGFNNLTTFYNSFQKELGIPPSQYRKKLLELKKENSGV